jgi:prevent-host-death family protein
MKASVREVKAHFSKYLRRAVAGEEITVTSRGTPVARLVRVTSPAPAKELTEAEIVRRLLSIPGIIPGAGGKPRGAKHPIRIRKGEKTLAEIVLEDRR